MVQLVDGCEPDEALSSELVAFCRKRLSPIKCPRTVDFRKEFPDLPLASCSSARSETNID